ncbi:MAG: hypothetical protein KAI91_03390, partial [Candidatus Omnitrophica bacterium]|nr:hypothetical protein [Candidatus Omnitrophota bacterium]
TLPEGVIEIPQKSLPLPASDGRLDDSKLSFNSKAEDKNYKLAVINVISAEPFENQTEVKEINDSISEVILPANNSPPVDNTTEMNNSQTSIELLFSDSDAFYYDTNNSITDNLSAIPYQIAIIGDTVGVEYENANTTYSYSEDFLPNYPVEIKIISDNNSVGDFNFTEKEVLINPYDMNFLANASTWISAERLFLPGEIKNLELKPTDHFYSFLYLNVKEGEVSIRFKDEEGRIIAERINGELIFNGPNNLLTLKEGDLNREVDIEVLKYQPKIIIVNVSSTGESAGVYAEDILNSKGLGWNNVEITYTDIYGNQLQAWANKNKLNYSVESKLDFETAITPYMIAISSSERDISNMVGSGEFVVVDKRTGLEAIAENSFFSRGREVLFNNETMFIDKDKLQFYIPPRVIERVGENFYDLIKDKDGNSRVKIFYYENETKKVSYLDENILGSLDNYVHLYLIEQAREESKKNISVLPVLGEIDEALSERLIDTLQGEIGLYSSHPGEGDWEMNDWGFTYDQALAAIYFIENGEREKAETILDFYVNASDLQVDFLGLFATAYDVNTGEAVEWGSTTGPSSWIGFAMAHYTETYNDTRYLPEIESIADGLLQLQDTNFGIRGGINIYWISTEHCLDTYVLFDYLAKKTGEQTYITARDQTWSWLYEFGYNKEAERFNRADNDPAIATDAQSWGSSIPSLPLDINRSSLIKFAEDNCRVSVNYTREDGQIVNVSGFSFKDNQDMVSIEWTAQMIIAYLENNQTEKAEFYLRELAKLQNSQGGLPYATEFNAATGHGWRTPPSS